MITLESEDVQFSHQVSIYTIKFSLLQFLTFLVFLTEMRKARQSLNHHVTVKICMPMIRQAKGTYFQRILESTSIAQW